MKKSFLIISVIAQCYAFCAAAFSLSPTTYPYAISKISLHMSSGGKKISKKKRRRRKAPINDGGASGASINSPTETNVDLDTGLDEKFDTDSKMDMAEIEAIANFKPPSDRSAPMGSSSLIADTASSPSDLAPGESRDPALIDLPDIRGVLERKELKKLEEEMKEEKPQRPKISRKDKAAFLQLLEEQPFADADDSYFVEEEYGTVSALLAEGARPFLGIPSGPLQVGHFIGALGIILMAFVEYPGFPLTNLPTPLRDCLQGGLLTIYGLNAILAIFATFKAAERGQPSGLWAVKTFSVGGLALDQLTQLPTLTQIEEIENRKGARAVKRK